MNERWIWALALYAVIAAGLWVLRKQSPFALPVLYLGITALMGSFFPLTSLYVTPRTWRNIANVSEETMLATQIDYLAFAVGLTLAILLASLLWPRAFRARSAAPRAPRVAVFRDTFTSWSLLGMGSLLYAEYIRRVGLDTLLSTHDFAEKYLSSRGMGSLILGLNLMIVACLWAEASDVRRSTKVFMRVVAAGIIIWAILFIAVRTYATALALGYIMIYCRNHRVQLRQIRLRVVLLLLVGYCGLESYAILRGTWMSTGNLGTALEMAGRIDADDALGGVVGGSELSHPFLTAAEVAQYEEAGALGGQSYVDAVLGVVPLFLWPGRPKTLAERYVAEYYPVMDARGGGTAFSFVGEAWWNFGHIIGPLLVGLALGWLLLWCHARSMLRPHGLIHRILPYMVFLTLMSHRSQLQASFKQVMTAVIPCIGFAIVGQLLWEMSNAKHTRPLPPSQGTRLQIPMETN